jgi:hypothetical protein
MRLGLMCPYARAITPGLLFTEFIPFVSHTAV